MTFVFFFSQIFATLATVFGIISYQFKERKKIILFFILTALCIGIQYLFLGRFVGAFIVALGIVRYTVSYYKPSKIFIPFFIIIFSGLTYIFWKDSYDLAVLFAASFNTIGVFQKNEKFLRIFMMIGGTLMVTYNFLIFSPVGVLLESIFLLSNLVGYYRHYIRKDIKNTTS